MPKIKIVLEHEVPEELCEQFKLQVESYCAMPEFTKLQASMTFLPILDKFHGHPIVLPLSIGSFAALGLMGGESTNIQIFANGALFKEVVGDKPQSRDQANDSFAE
jgi:hypothetical protein